MKNTKFSLRKTPTFFVLAPLKSKFLWCPLFFYLRFQDITGLSRAFLKEFKDIFLQISGQSRTYFIYLEKLQDIQGQQLI